MRSFSFVLISLLSLMIGCSHPFPKAPFDARWQKDTDRKPISAPQEFEQSETWDRVYNHGARQLYHFIDVPRHGKNLLDLLEITDPKAALNVNQWDEVPNSTWFTNRIGKEPISISTFLKGPLTGGPNMSGPWTIISGKSDGVTPGFVILDKDQKLFFIKFNPTNNPEIGSRAEFISTQILYAAGYNVPENYIVRLPLKLLTLSPKAKIKGKYNVKRPMTQADLDRILKTIDRLPGDCVIVTASKALPGKPMGPFEFEGTRGDDPNDKIPHEHRRELRAYHLFSAWLNNADIRTQNTLDMYIGEPGKGYIQHNFLDFGSSLGNAGDLAKNKKDGYEHWLDYSTLASNFITFGLKPDYWENNEYSGFPSVGLFESKNFDPLKWRTRYSNNAFEHLEDRDGFWATKIIMSFSDGMLRSLIKKAGYFNSKAGDYLTKILIERRNKFAEIWFKKMTPLDNFEIGVDSKKNSQYLSFDDLGLRHNVDTKKDRHYTFQVIDPNNNGLLKTIHTTSNTFHLSFLFNEHKIEKATIRIQVNQGKLSRGKGVEVFAACPKRRQCIIAGIRRLS